MLVIRYTNGDEIRIEWGLIINESSLRHIPQQPNTMYCNTGDNMEGCFIGGKITKYGKIHKSNEDTYEGVFSDGKLSGPGKATIDNKIL